MFDIKGRIAVITGGYGVLGSSMAECLSKSGVHVAIVGRKADKGEPLAAHLSEIGAEAMFCQADVLDKEALQQACDAVVAKWGRIDILINAAGGNMPGATIPPGNTFMDIDLGAFSSVIDLNLMGTVVPTVVFGAQMAGQGAGSIINISSMSAQKVITRVVGYSAAKAAIDNFTRWMAFEMGRKFGEGIRVNAIAPGFFITEQNRTLMTNPDGSLSDRAKDVVRMTAFGRLGEAEELNGAIVFYASDASKFVTGTVLPIDGGFSIFSGV
ncbi:MAG: SDR family oxidoreductase [Rikenellaceae bacterium]|jgi:NAD(P)-dependent dehydrogenase (short-subunit alcohol dehydrogenase family)|nr:SDR family oxidoreductase [Rikenellaceae bacterium]